MRTDLIKFIKKISFLLILVILLYSPVFYFNFIIDPYGIFRNDFTEQRIEPNSHFIKLRHILNHPKEFDSFIFGNSRANNIDNKKIQGGKFYNLYYSIGFPNEHLIDIKILLSRKINIKNVLICLDFATYSAGDWGRQNDALRKPYPSSKWDLLKFYTEYIFKVPEWEFQKKLFSVPKNTIYKNILLDGRAVNSEAEHFIESNKTTHQQDDKFKQPSIIGTEDHVDETIEHLSAIIKLCEENKIQVKFLINPVHKTSYLGNNLNLHFSFLKKLVQITDYYDFSGINKVNSNNYFYYETAHFRPIIGDAIIDFVYKHKKIHTIPEFGFLVNKNNIESHLLNLKTEIAK